MRLLRNIGNDRVIDRLEAAADVRSADFAVSALSVFGLEAVRRVFSGLDGARILLAKDTENLEKLWGSDLERSQRNELNAKYLSRALAQWIKDRVQVRQAAEGLPQSLIAWKSKESGCALVGNCALTAEGLGLAPGNRLGLVQATESEEEYATFGSWFEEVWTRLPGDGTAGERLIERLRFLSSDHAPSLLYYLILHRLFSDRGEEIDEERIIKSATGIRNSAVWKKLYKFQRDGVVGAIDKLERFGGAIIADSVGLGKTFEALAIIKYYELRNDRVLVLCPKRLRDNWTLYASNDLRNSLARDRFHYDVLNHTDLSREEGFSGDIDLAYVNWGNYDLVVIDESHNFRNKAAHRDHVSRYERLMRQIIRTGVKTRVLMLSATPVNNRLADLKNQIAFITEGEDTALENEGIPSVNNTLQRAQKHFNQWLKLEEDERKAATLLETLNFDYFKLLDLLTIARSRKHVIRYYGTAETGAFPERLPPINKKPEVDLAGCFPSIRSINDEIRRLHLAAYAPLRYVLPHKQQVYDDHYSQRLKGGKRVFRQVDREESLVALMRINLLKRMESSVVSFALTVRRQLADVDRLIAKIDAHEESIEELTIEDVDPDDAAFESLMVGRKVKVLLQDMDRIRWRQDLLEDRNRLATLASASGAVKPENDAKLAELRALLTAKVRSPINPGNRKVLLFTAFADTAEYLYAQIAPWARESMGLETALVTGTGTNRSTLRTLRTDLGSILSAFSPVAKERGEAFAEEGELDLLIATDCISEGQNLQDCDYLINFDIHWNPVRIIQRFGRIDRLGSKNTCIQLVNFWPNIELDEYINLEQRVSGRMVLLDISATGEENIIEHQSGNQMNDLEYRRKQLLRLQDTVIDLEDLSGGVSITDLTLNDFRVDLAGVLREKKDLLDTLPPTAFAVTTTAAADEGGIPSGALFCLRATQGVDGGDPHYPLAPNYLVHVGDDGAVLLAHTQVKQLLDRLRQIAFGRDLPDVAAVDQFNRATRNGADMGHYRTLLGHAIRAVLGRREERAVESLFEPGGTQALADEIAGAEDFEVVGWIAILAEEEA